MSIIHQKTGSSRDWTLPRQGINSDSGSSRDWTLPRQGINPDSGSSRDWTLPIGFSVIENKYTTTYNHIEQNILNDKIYMEMIFNGSLISNNVYPIIYDQISDFDINHYRSLQYHQNIKSINNLTDTEKIIYLVGLRDLTFAINNLKFNFNIDDIISDIVISDFDIIIENVRISPFPSKSHCIIQWLDIKNKLPPSLAEHYISNNGLVMCFVNMYDLSYRNFENIIDLNSHCEKINLHDDYDSFEKLDLDVYKFKIDSSFLQLMDISKLNLLTKPLNSNDRGGKRLIFQSEHLAKLLSNIIKKINQPLLNNNFERVNHVFRFNVFSPLDNKFISHYDTPYVNPRKQLISKYTLIIYLTGETSELNHPLTVKNKPYKINELDAFIFGQNSEHEGKPFTSNDKIFLRTELIYHDYQTIYNEKTAELFNRSCYCVKQSIFNPTIKQYINDMFNSVTKMRYSLSVEKKNYPMFLKKYGETNYITNGHHYWAKITNEESVKHFAVVILKDYFGQIPGQVISGGELNELDDDTIYKLLKNSNPDEIFDLHPDKFINNFNGKEYILGFWKDFKCGMCDEYMDMEYLCNYENCVNNINQIVSDTNSLCDKFSLIVSGEKIFINKKDIDVSNGVIYFKNTGLQNQIIFASCQGHDSDFVNINAKLSNVKTYNLPPIFFSELDNNCYKFNVDVFNNGLIHNSAFVKLPGDCLSDRAQYDNIKLILDTDSIDNTDMVQIFDESSLDTDNIWNDPEKISRYNLLLDYNNFCIFDESTETIDSYLISLFSNDITDICYAHDYLINYNNRPYSNIHVLNCNNNDYIDARKYLSSIITIFHKIIDNMTWTDEKISQPTFPFDITVNNISDIMHIGTSFEKCRFPNNEFYIGMYELNDYTDYGTYINYDNIKNHCNEKHFLFNFFGMLVEKISPDKNEITMKNLYSYIADRKIYYEKNFINENTVMSKDNIIFRLALTVELLRLKQIFNELHNYQGSLIKLVQLMQLAACSLCLLDEINKLFNK